MSYARIILAGLLLAVACSAAAVPVRGLYEASVSVPDQSAAARDPALRRALEEVLVRVTGTRVLPEPAASAVLQRATVLVQGYGYEADAGGKELRLRARFDPRAVDAALRAQGLTVWGANRPSHVVWVALRDDGQPRALLDTTAVATRAAALLETAEARGLPFTFPTLDAAERRQVTFNEVWSGVVDGVQAASARYDTSMIVVARVGREGGRWLGRWTLLDRSGETEEWAGAHDTLAQALAAGVHELADREGQRFAVHAGRAQDVRLDVAGVDSLRDYGRVLSYFRSLNPVRSAQIAAVRNDVLTVRLHIEGDTDTLARVIAAGNVLRPQPEAGYGSAQSYVLVR